MRSAAQILQERKFGGLLRKAVEEGLEGVRQRGNNAGEGEKKDSKKRKRGMTPMELVSVTVDENMRLRCGIYEAVAQIIMRSKPADGGSSAFEAEYMRSVVRMSSDEAARILGAWLEWNLTPWTTSTTDMKHEDWLSPFVEIWAAHVGESEDVKIFSKYCLQALLKLLGAKDLEAQLKSQLERLLARNVVIPCRTAYDASSDATLLKALVTDIISNEPSLATVLFNVTVRCIQPHPSRRRRPHETAWLQSVFGVCKDAIGLSPADATNPSNSNTALRILLKSAKDCHVALDLLLLRSIVSESAFVTENATDWNIVATIMSMDSDVFLIPNPEANLLQEFLNRITNATFKDNKCLLQDQLCDDIVVPLMGEFAKARNLTGFVHHWYEQMEHFQTLLSDPKAMPRDFLDPCVWEDDRLQYRLKELLEPSLTTKQVADLVDWLIKKTNSPTNYVPLEAIAVAISRDEMIDVVAEMLAQFASDHIFVSTMDGRYEARLWRIGTLCLQWAANADDSAWSTSFAEQSITMSTSVLNMGKERQQGFLHVFADMARLFCAAWTLGVLKELPASAWDWTQLLSNGLDSLIAILKLDWKASDPLKDDKKKRNEFRQMQYCCRIVAQCICVDHPHVLE